MPRVDVDTPPIDPSVPLSCLYLPPAVKLGPEYGRVTQIRLDTPGRAYYRRKRALRH